MAIRLCDFLATQSNTQIERDNRVQITYMEGPDSFREVPLTIYNIAQMAKFYVVAIDAADGILDVIVQKDKPEFNFASDIYPKNY